VRILAVLALTIGTAAQADDTANTFPVLRPAAMFTPAVLAALPHKDFPDGLVEAWVVDTAGYLTYLDAGALAETGQDLPTVEARALDNLSAKAAGATWTPLQNVQALALDGVYESSVLLLPQVWMALDAKIGTVVVAVPTRDVVLLADGDDAAQVATLRAIVRQVRGKYPNPVTDTLLRWDGAGWQVLP
jgi:hypothetical protein